jgi:Xaa-Pro aminopeptidase
VTARISSLTALFAIFKIDALLLCDDASIFYLTGYPAHESWLLVTTQTAHFITDSRYYLEAQEGLKATGIEVIDSGVLPVALTLSLAKRWKIRALGLDERRVNAALVRRLRTDKPASLSLKAADGIVDGLRMVKDVFELDKIKAAIKINLQLYKYLSARIRDSRREIDYLQDLEGFVRRKKVAFSFPPIIASGPNAAMPHARVTGRKLSTGEALLVDVGVEKDGYKSDLTRMFFLGKMSLRFRQVFSHVQEAQLKAIARIKPGVAAKDIDSAARLYLKEKSLDQYFGHSLGHGVGIDVHEMPSISQRSNIILKEGMVFTVEPGVYIPGQFGVRLEEMVLVTKTGCEVLSVDRN